MKEHFDLIIKLVRTPRIFFETTERRNVFRTVLTTFGIILGASTVLLFLAAVANLGALKQASLAMQNYMPGSQATGFAGSIPWNRLFFPVIWFVAVFVTGLLRHLTLTILGESNRSLALTQAICLCGFLPALLALSLSGFLSTFFPIVPGLAGGQGAGSRFAVWISLIAMILAIVLDGRISISGLKAFYGQNTGRAVVTWLSPVILGTLAFAFLYVLMVLLLLSAKSH